MYKCDITQDSISTHSRNRVTTMKVTFPRFILAEKNTHRMFTRNSASSRAIPAKKMRKMVMENPVIPIAWQKDHSGMQGNEYITDPAHIQECIDAWLEARDYAVHKSSELNVDGGVTKQLCNRLLETFLWHTVLVTSSDWENFFNLRCPQYELFSENMPLYFRSKKDFNNYVERVGDTPFNLTDIEWLQINKSGAEIHIQAIAELMWDAYNESIPKEIGPGEWHIPFGDNMNDDDLFELLSEKDKEYYNSVPEEKTFTEKAKKIRLSRLLNPSKIKIATARCARISYETLGDNPKIDYKADIDLHDRLIVSKPLHASPGEHPNRCMTDTEYFTFSKTYFVTELSQRIKDEVSDGSTSIERLNNGFKITEYGWCNNIRGFIQYRFILENNLPI